MSLDPWLAQLQEALLTGLADGRSGAEVRQAAAEAVAGTADADWVAAWDEDLLELAGVLVQTWARTDDAPRATSTGDYARQVDR